MAEETKDNIDFRKKRVKRIKKIIVVLCILLFILPVVLSIVLFSRVKKLENRIETIISENKLETGRGDGRHCQRKGKGNSNGKCH